MYKHAASVYQAGSGESGSEALKRRWDELSGVKLHSGGGRHARGRQKITYSTLAGANGGGVMRGDSVGGLWGGGLEVIVRDFTSMASVRA